MASTLGGLLVIHFHVQFGIAHNHSVVTSNVDLVDDCYVCAISCLGVRMSLVSVFDTPFGLFHVHLILLSSET